jgi:hypothetical protein
MPTWSEDELKILATTIVPTVLKDNRLENLYYFEVFRERHSSRHKGDDPRKLLVEALIEKESIIVEKFVAFWLIGCVFDLSDESYVCILVHINPHWIAELKTWDYNAIKAFSFASNTY